MATPRINLADPGCEPTDEDFAGLMDRAFANVKAENERRLEKLREEIAAARVEVMRRLRLVP
jgi:hypothetical protein